jgi:hypothetical protein
MNEKKTTCHDCHGFKWYINISPIFTIFFRHPTSFLAHFILTIPIVSKLHYACLGKFLFEKNMVENNGLYFI